MADEIRMSFTEAIERVGETRRIIRVMHLLQNEVSDQDMVDYQQRIQALKMAEEALREKMDDGK